MSTDTLAFLPRKGTTYQVLVIARISTENQDLRSNDDQLAYCRRHLEERCHGPTEYYSLHGQGSGEYLDREELTKANELIESGRFDLVICEDLGRIMRRVQAYLFCEMCEDENVRLVAINDHIDTFRGDWRLNAIFASFKHEMSNKDTSDRIKRTLRNRFEQFGGALSSLGFGYVKPPGAKTDKEIHKDPAAESIYDEWFRRLEEGASYGEVSDWLNELGIDPGPRSKGYWTASLVCKRTHNTILKGERQKNNWKTKRLNKTGRRKIIRTDPSEVLRRQCPHLAFIQPARYDRVVRLLKKRYGNFVSAQQKSARQTGNWRKHTTFPGQHARCGVCGRLYYWGGHGRVDDMMCSGAKNHRCWNGITFDGKRACQLIAEAILMKVESLPDFDIEFRRIVEARLNESDAERKNSRDKLRLELVDLDRKIGNVTDAVALTGYSPALRARLMDLENCRQVTNSSLEALNDQPLQEYKIPPMADLKRMVREAIARQDIQSAEYYRIMCRLVPELHILPYRLLEGKTICARAMFILDLAPLLGPNGLQEELRGLVRHRVMVDLCDHPTRELIRERVVVLRRQGVGIRAIAKQLGHNASEVQRSMKIQKIMDENELTDSYYRLTSPPDDCGNLRRHRHERFHYEPMDGYPLAD